MSGTGRSRRTVHSKARTGGRKLDGIYPFRILALFLTIGILIELAAILRLPDYSDERERAKHDYLIAEAENFSLQKALEIARDPAVIEDSARDQGYTYYGETIYVPIIDAGEANPDTF
ncbi:MAG: hypothetical protein IJT77_00540 [Clostridia bacterium]|nr:hypothetical protein [Clostridia bacterium]